MITNATELRTEVSSLKATRRGLLNRLESLASRGMDPESQAAFEGLVQQVKDLDARLTQAETELSQLTDSPDPQEDGGGLIPEMPNQRDLRRVRPAPDFIKSAFELKRSNDQDELFRAFIRSGTMVEQRFDNDTLMRGGALNNRTLELPAGLTSDAVVGNYLVPKAFLSSYLTSLKLTCNWLDFCRVLSTGSGETIAIPTNTDPVGENANGSGWLAQLGPDSDLAPSISEITLVAHTVSSGLIVTSWELAQDSGVPLGQLMGSIMGERVGRALDLAFAKGSGTGQPLGIATSFPAGQNVAAAVNNAISSDDLLAVIGKLDPAYAASQSCRWVMHPSTMIALRRLKDSTGKYLFEPDAQTGAPASLFGYPVVLSSNIDEIGAGKSSIFFGDWSRYIIRQAQSTTIRKSDDYLFNKRATAWVAYARFDAKLSDSRAIVALKHGA
jgi:HK97 family phage major capsid protein